MPKELIYEPPGVAFRDDPLKRGVVDVRWDAESGYFQVGTHSSDAEGPYMPEEANSLNVQSPIPAEYGWYVSLDRRGINDLIRVLRRARDQAYGKDE